MYDSYNKTQQILVGHALRGSLVSNGAEMSKMYRRTMKWKKGTNLSKDIKNSSEWHAWEPWIDCTDLYVGRHNKNRHGATLTIV
jgi:hypothetical protein